VDQENDNIEFENATHEFEVQRKDLEKNIAQEKATQNESQGEADAQQASIDSLTADLEDIAKKLEANKNNEESVNENRDSENGTFQTTQQTLEEIVQAMKDCLAELAKGTALLDVTKQKEIQAVATAFMQPRDQVELNALLQAPADPSDRVYDSKTGKVTDIFEKLLRRSQDRLNDTRKQEQRAVNAHGLSIQALQAEADALTKLQNDKNAAKSQAETAHGAAIKARDDAKTAFDDFTKNLKDTTKTYADQTDRHNTVTKERSDEVEAMVQAVDILEQVSGVRAEHVPAFLQLSSMSPKDQIVALLHKMGHKLESSELEEASMKINAVKGGPFNQIKNIIQKLVDQLVREQTAEDNHKAWCDSELQTTHATKEDQTTKLEKVEIAQNKANSLLEENQRDKKDARQQITDLTKQKADETAQRKRENKTNGISIADAKKAQKGLQKALTVLNEWREGRDKSTTKTEQNDAVFNLLENAETHYAQMQADVQSSESQAQLDHQESLGNIKISIATLDAQIKGHDDSVDRLSRNLANLGSKHKHHSDALFEVNQYLDDLAPACVGKKEGAYEERKQKREDEKKALKDAQGILADAFKGLKLNQEERSIKMHF